jgi:uncharacterized protein (TIGR02266 family)
MMYSTAMTESSRIERRLHFRGKAKAGRRVDLAYRLLGESGTPGDRTEAVTSNIGAGGAFILCAEPAAIGTKLVVELVVPTAEQTILADAEVRWVVDDGDEAGMGVKFKQLDVESVLALSQYFASLTTTPAES